MSVREAMASSRLGVDGLDGILDAVSSGGDEKRVIPSRVVENTFRFVRMALPRDGGLGLGE